MSWHILERGVNLILTCSSNRLSHKTPQKPRQFVPAALPNRLEWRISPSHMHQRFLFPRLTEQKSTWWYKVQWVYRGPYIFHSQPSWLRCCRLRLDLAPRSILCRRNIEQLHLTAHLRNCNWAISRRKILWFVAFRIPIRRRKNNFELRDGKTI
jgi:hypothetical protein